MIKRKAKFYYNHKNRSIVYVDVFGSSLEVKCNEKDDVDIYVGAALALSKHYFGSTTKFMKYVESHFVGNKPEDYEVEEPQVEKAKFEEKRTLEEAIAEEVEYPVGTRVMAIPEDRNSEVIGEVIEYDFENQEYVIEWKPRNSNSTCTFRCRGNKIIRRCRAANKGKEI